MESVKKKLDDESMDTDEPSDQNSSFVDMFSKRGKKQHSSGKSKVVRIAKGLVALPED